MSLIKRRRMTQATPAGMGRKKERSRGQTISERVCGALRRHGFDTQAEEAAMRDLGEDPAQFHELLEGLWMEHDPVGFFEEGLVIRLARAIWLMNRADRMQEGYALRQAQDVSVGREDRRHVQMMRLKMTANTLRTLARSVAQENYFTPREDLEMMKTLQQQGEVKELGGMALDLFLQLQKPGTDKDGTSAEEQNRRVLTRVRAIFGLDTEPACFNRGNAAPTPPQDGPPGTGATLPAPQVAGAPQAEPDEAESPSPEEEAHERARQLLENLLMRMAEICEAQRRTLREESRKGPSPYERAAEIAPTHPHAAAMQKMEDHALRQVERIKNMLMKIKRQDRQMEAIERTDKVMHERMRLYTRKQSGYTFKLKNQENPSQSI